MKTDVHLNEAKKERNYPFWSFDGNGNPKIHGSRLVKFLEASGFYRHQASRGGIHRNEAMSIVQDDDGVLKMFGEKSLKRWVQEYLEENEEELDLDLILDKWLSYPITPVCDGLTNLDDDDKVRLKDVKDVCYLPFKDKVVEITSDTITQKTYKELEDKGTIWETSIIPHGVDISKISNIDPKYPVVLQVVQKLGDSPYTRFVISSFKKDVEPTKGGDLTDGVINKDDNSFNEEWVDSINGFETGLGYLIHQFHSSDDRIVFFVDGDSMASGNAEGGTGKSLSLRSLGHIRNRISIDGKRVGMDGGRFLFSDVRPDTQIIVIDDINPDFNQKELFNVVTGDMEVEKKGVNKVVIPEKDKPKMAITSNYVLPDNDTSTTRRQHLVSFGNFLNKVTNSKDVDTKDIFGCELFGDDFSKEDWNHFFVYHILCVQKYLKTGLISPKNETYHQSVLEAQVDNPDVVEWMKDWVDGERITSGCDKDGVSTSQIYKSFSDHFVGETFLIAWNEKFFLDKLFDYVVGRDDLEWNPDLASKGYSRRKRRWRIRVSGIQVEGVKVVNVDGKEVVKT